MVTQEEMLEQGIRRELKMMATHAAQEIIVDLAKIGLNEGDHALYETCVAFVQSANRLMERWNAENQANYAAFTNNQAEVDQLEAMLALGGEELGSTDADA